VHVLIEKAVRTCAFVGNLLGATMNAVASVFNDRD
jgi:hypothetical protein